MINRLVGAIIGIGLCFLVSCGGYVPRAEPQLIYDHDGWTLPKTEVGPYNVVFSMGHLPGDTTELNKNVYAGFIESEFFWSRTDSLLPVPRSSLRIDSLVFRQDTTAPWIVEEIELLESLGGKSTEGIDTRFDSWRRGPAYSVGPITLKRDLPLFTMISASSFDTLTDSVVAHVDYSCKLTPTTTNSGCVCWVTGELANYPNPFCPTTTVSYVVPELCPVLLVIYNVPGQIVDTLVNDTQMAGRYKVDALKNKRLESGLYFYKLTTCDVEVTKKLLLLK